VVVGILGGPGRVEYAIIGDTVNVAARLEALNKELHTQILLSESTQHRLGGALPISRLGTFPIRGKADAMQVFTVLSQPAA
jgi:class 3 adenylate cyclase